MDTSEQYIKMCEKAEEIQSLAIGDGEPRYSGYGTFISNSVMYGIAGTNQCHDYDGYYHVTDKEGMRKCRQCGTEESYIESSKYIWLPCQDQLQEMVSNNCYVMVEKVYNYASATGYTLKHPLESMEQLWLAFVMREKYNKAWDGERWSKLSY